MQCNFALLFTNYKSENSLFLCELSFYIYACFIRTKYKAQINSQLFLVAGAIIRRNIVMASFYSFFLEGGGGIEQQEEKELSLRPTQKQADEYLSEFGRFLRLVIIVKY